MPSLRKRVSSYFRQLSFHNESRDKKHNVNENTFVTKYLQGLITLSEGPPIIYGKNPMDLPNYELGHYEIGSNTIIGCYSGPNGGLTTVKRTEKHLCLPDADIDFIDTHEEETVPSALPKKSPNKILPGPIDNTTMVIKVAGHEYCVTNKSKRHSKSHSMGSISDFNNEIEKTKLEKSFYNSNNNCETVECKNNLALNNNVNDSISDCEPKETCGPKNDDCEINVNGCSSVSDKNVETKKTTKTSTRKKNIEHTSVRAKSERNPALIKTNTRQGTSDVNNKSDNAQRYGLSKSKSEGNPFHHKKRGRIIKIERPNTRGEESVDNRNIPIKVEDSALPNEWNKRSDLIYGLSDSLYDRNQVTRNKNGDPIADCFGIIARKDSAILAVADGVNWGEKASVAAKSAVHGSLHYLNKTIFKDTKPFENLTIKTEESSACSSVSDENVNLISNTREVFVCLLRAFNCAHDLILENKGMLTTLTVAVILPLKQKLERKVHSSAGGGERREWETQFVCCVCNVGDTLAYVYSQKYGVRELTKGYCTPDTVAVHLSIPVGENKMELIVCSAYFPGDRDADQPPSAAVREIVTYSRRNNIQLIIGCDANSHHTAWGSTDINQRGSHDIHCNRDMRDALGALGPVDGINPELSNLTLSITTLRKGDIVMVASDGLTDNFDPNVCKFTVNCNVEPPKPKRTTATRSVKNNPPHSSEEPKIHPTKPVKIIENPQKPPVKPPRRSKNRDDSSRSSAERSEKSSSPSIESVTEAQKITADQPKSSEVDKITNDEVSNNPQTSTVSEINSQKIVEASEVLGSSSNKPEVDYGNPLVQQFIRANSVEESPKVEKNTKKPAVVENKASSLRRQASSQVRQENPQSSQKPIKQISSKTLQTLEDTNSASKKQDVGYKFLRSKTSLDIRSSNIKQVLRNEDGIPYITPIQRYELQLLLMEDVLKHGISGKDSPCTSARKLCENLVSFTISITSAKRHTLEDQDLYFDNRNGVLVEVSSQEKKMRRKKGLERVQNLPGKLDHVTVAAYNVGNFAH